MSSIIFGNTGVLYVEAHSLVISDIHQNNYHNYRNGVWTTRHHHQSSCYCCPTCLRRGTNIGKNAIAQVPIHKTENIHHNDNTWQRFWREQCNSLLFTRTAKLIEFSVNDSVLFYISTGGCNISGVSVTSTCFATILLCIMSCSPILLFWTSSIPK